MNYSAWAKWYDVVYSLGDPAEIDFYVDLAVASGGPVLEIGVGTGRVALPSWQAGADLLGIDAHPPMLRRLQRKLEALEDGTGALGLVCADMRRLPLGGRSKFALVTMPARTLLLATTPEDQQRTLEQATACLAPEGRLALNVFNPRPEVVGEDASEPFFWGEAQSPESSRRRLLWATNRFDTTSQINRGLQIIEELNERGEVVRKVHLDVLIRYLYPSELHGMMDDCGLEPEGFFGDFHGSPYSAESSEIVVIARRS